MPFKRGKKSKKGYRAPYIKRSRQSLWGTRGGGPYGVIQRSIIDSGKKVHYFKRKAFSSWTFNFTTSDITASTTGTAIKLQGSDIRLNYLSNVGDFTGLFDLYRINGIKISFLNGYNVGNRSDVENTNQNLTLGVPTLHITSDQDDSIAPSALSDILERPYCKSMILDQKRTFYFKPRVDREGYDGASNYNYIQNSRPYIDMAQTNIIHNGLKYGLTLPFENRSGSATSFVIELPIVTTYFLEFRNPR